MSFKKLNLSNKILITLKKLNYNTPTKVQKKSIPLFLKRKDLLVTSQTGTGKTAAFILPLLENLKEKNFIKRGKERYKIEALILAPTRELVIQIHHKIEIYSENFSHRSVALYGGVRLGSQVSAIRAGANIAVGTTKRVLDHIKNGSLDLSEVEVLVLDEADKMLEMGFIDEIRKISSQLPKERHTVMFSATFPKPIMQLAKSILRNPIIIEVEREDISSRQVKQMVVYVNEEDKVSLLCKIITKNRWEQVLVFVNTKFQANKIVEYLRENDIKAQAIHGDKTQRMRIEALSNFKVKKITVLVATDLASRGIDIVNLPYVINFNLPLNSESYIHRVGRTGRAEGEGLALSLVSKEEKKYLKEIEILINKQLEIFKFEAYNFQKGEKFIRSTMDIKRAKALAEKMMEKGEHKKKKKIKRDVK